MKKTPKIGAFVLETLTTGMYTNPLDTLREYIQNSSDSIRRAEQSKLLKDGEGRVEIKIFPKERQLVVRDNGMGIPSDTAADRLVNIGMSEKDIGTDAGFRGIGRLAGIAYCKTLTFRTTAVGESDVTVVSIDCGRVRQAISPALRGSHELTEVFADCSDVRTETCTPAEHFLEVIMEGVDTSSADFLNWQVLENYLSQIAPVKYDAHHFLFAPKIEQWARKHGVSEHTITLVITAPGVQREVFKPYKGMYKTKQNNYQVEIMDVAFYPENPGPDTPFWAWYGKSDLLGMISDERSAGLRFRQSNIGLGGPDKVAELFTGGEGRLNAWFIGEIHIRTKDVVPNGRRDGFEHTEAWVQLKSQLAPLVSDLIRACRDTSASENRPTAKVVASAKSVVSSASEAIQAGFSSREEHSTLLKKVEKEEERVGKALETRKGTEEGKQIASIAKELQGVRKSLEDDDNYTVKNLRSSLSRRERGVLQEVLQVIRETVPADSSGKCGKCFNALKTAILAHFSNGEGGQEK